MTSPLRAMVNSYLLVVIGGPTLDATEGGERMPSRRGGDPAFRPLKAFAFDPSRGRNLDNFVSFSVPYERLTPGPVGEYVAVIDFDASNGSYYEAADLDSPEVLIRGGLDPSESDPRFHSQMVYAVVSDTIRRFEFALGRKISWREASGREAGPPLAVAQQILQDDVNNFALRHPHEHHPQKPHSAKASAGDSPSAWRCACRVRRFHSS